jgi:thiol-disulfide isomerase/thioredoxin
VSRRLIWLACVTLLAAAGAQGATATPTAGPGLVKGDRRVVPTISGSDPVTGKRVSLAAWSGKPVVINIWGSWCRPCNKEAPVLARFARRHPGVVVGLDIGDSRAGARRFYRRYKLPYPSIFDPKGKEFRKLRARGAPTTIFLDRRHRVVAELLGAGKLEGFEQGLRLARGRASR